MVFESNGLDKKTRDRLQKKTDDELRELMDECNTLDFKLYMQRIIDARKLKVACS